MDVDRAKSMSDAARAKAEELTGEWLERDIGVPLGCVADIAETLDAFAAEQTARAEAAESLVGKMQGYTQHRCNVRMSGKEEECTCGLSVLLADPKTVSSSGKPLAT